ncbi:hypothetical protein CIL05_17135 [Virgibacillus profundi]|uniref:HEPN domain-containing protein n=1 Tax=Virgibacillus profundi TaxID=2024555 RepID=A0A2A2I9P4_9BACI|nr:hypothetical protein [Virgibacillus profundi]PAV28357.1 hypothetical protein CIL05_17135 [Virgibacillus profundi]PXY52281.1 hypothetical protein CIT14_18640 [Virgibacillus profundi]
MMAALYANDCEVLDKKIVNKIYTHDLTRLLGVIGASRPEQIKVNWSVVRDWSEKDRYIRYTNEETEDIFRGSQRFY